MAPKFRGNSDDWLDDQRHTSGKKKKQKKAITARRVQLDPSEANATVIEVHSKQCKVRLDSNLNILLCSYRWADLISKSGQNTRERTPVCVGDRVAVEVTDSSSGVVDGLCIRKNELVRPAPGRDGERYSHALAANLDLLVVVASLKDPTFSPGLVDRFLVAAQAEKISPILVVTKVDLQSDQQQPSPWKIYEEYGYRVYEVSSKTRKGVDLLLEELTGKQVAFCGQSGVGKTSLLRMLLGREIGRVGEVNEFTGKGRHTTTGAVLLEGPQGSHWIDTPGVREFGLAKVTPEALGDLFPEFQGLECRQKLGCLHREESECVAKGLYRYSSYRRILESLISGEF